MRKAISTLLAVSLATIIIGFIFDLNKMLTSSIVLSGCLTGTLIGDAIKREESIMDDMKIGLLVLGILCILLMGLFIIDYFLHLSMLPVSMPKLVIGIFCFSSLSIASCIGLVWFQRDAGNPRQRHGH